MIGVPGREGNRDVQVIIGVDTHQDEHVAVAIDRQGVRCNFLAHSEGILIFHRRDDSDRLSSVDIGSVSFSRTGQEMSNLCLPLRTPHGFVDWLIARWEQGQTQFTVEKRGRSVNFLDLRATVRPDLGRIVTSDPVLPT